MLGSQPNHSDFRVIRYLNLWRLLKEGIDQLGFGHRSEPFLSQHKGLCLGARHKLHMLGSQPNHSDFLEYY